MTTHHWLTPATPGAATHAYAIRTRDAFDTTVRSACGYASTTYESAADAPTTVPQHEGCAFCRRVLGMAKLAADRSGKRKLVIDSNSTTEK